MAPGRTRKATSTNADERPAKRQARGRATAPSPSPEPAPVSKAPARGKAASKAKAPAPKKTAPKKKPPAKGKGKAPVRGQRVRFAETPPPPPPPASAGKDGSPGSGGGYNSADFSDQTPSPRPEARAGDLPKAPEDFFGRLSGVFDTDLELLNDAEEWSTSRFGERVHIEAWALRDQIRRHHRRLEERKIQDAEVDTTVQHYRWVHPNLFAPQDHTGDTMKLMKKIDTAIASWVDIVFKKAPTWDMIRYADKDWLMAWAPKARVWLETPQEHGYKALMCAWVWRIIYDQLLSRDAPADKWQGEQWLAWRKFQESWEDTNNFPFNPDVPTWYRAAKFANTRMLFAKHGFHTSAARLKAKILDPFRHLNLTQPDDAAPGQIRRAEKELNEIAHRALRLDLILISSPLVMDISWRDPATRWQHGFPYVKRAHDGETDLMQARVRDHTNDEAVPRTLEGRAVDFIARPLLRIWGKVTQESDVAGPIVVKNNFKSAYHPSVEPALQVMVDNDENAVTENGREDDDNQALTVSSDDEEETSDDEEGQEESGRAQTTRHPLGFNPFPFPGMPVLNNPLLPGHLPPLGTPVDDPMLQTQIIRDGVNIMPALRQQAKQRWEERLKRQRATRDPVADQEE